MTIIDNKSSMFVDIKGNVDAKEYSKYITEYIKGIDLSNLSNKQKNDFFNWLKIEMTSIREYISNEENNDINFINVFELLNTLDTTLDYETLFATTHQNLPEIAKACKFNSSEIIKILSNEISILASNAIKLRENKMDNSELIDSVAYLDQILSSMNGEPINTSKQKVLAMM